MVWMLNSASANRSWTANFRGMLAKTPAGVLMKSATALTIIEYERTEQRQLCNRLELLADQLPEDVDHSLCEGIYEKLRFELPIYHRNEEALFDLISRHPPSKMDVSPILKYVRQEHAIHNCYADELHESLEVLRTGGYIQNPEMIGYMLRCSFETLRRHLEWEDLTVMPLAGRFLTTADFATLTEILAENRRELKPNII